MKKTPPQDPFRRLQQHLDRLPVGFPASKTGADIRLLKHIFTPEQAAVAACLSHEAKPLEDIFQGADHLVPTPEGLEKQLRAMVKAGGIEMRIIDGIRMYANTPLVVGMYELQAERLTPEFIRDFKAYTNEKPFGISFLSTARSQMRTIPVNKSIPLNIRAADFDRVTRLIDTASPPFVILPCICRSKKAMEGQSCKKTLRTETCLAMGHAAQNLIEMGAGRKISKEEAKSIIRMNQDDGLVLQPSNTRDVAFICSCCGCCCSMLSLHQELPLPLDFWTANFRAVLDKERCVGCGKCVEACQTGAFTWPKATAEKSPEDKKPAPPRLRRTRCIGCGLCISGCPTRALTLVQVNRPVEPPENRDALNREIQRQKKGIGKVRTLVRLAKGMALTGDMRLLIPPKKD